MTSGTHPDRSKSSRGLRFSRRTLLAATAAGLALPARAITPVDGVRARETSLTLADGRVVPINIWAPAVGGPHPLMLFSHGANSRPDKYENLARPLAAAGYVVAAPTHADSPDHPGGGKIEQAMATGMRMQDVRAMIARRAELGASAGKVIAAGHSYGGLVAQILCGARSPASGTATDPVDADVVAALAYSPPGEWLPSVPGDSWKTVSKPMFVQTGTADMLPGLAPDWRAHRLSFDTTPAPAVLFVGEGVDHYFGNLICRPERTEPPQRVQLDSAIAVSLAFLEKVRGGQSLDGLKSLETPMGWVEVR
ncbi:alpha/beta hydrolase family protein [Polymorphobacter sp.]|uniref:alpha/beta hydrolase family protein n=1 Tax=Polymorphobacter sp. TaxID=1909290 RepID=UPI003F7198E7